MGRKEKVELRTLPNLDRTVYPMQSTAKLWRTIVSHPSLVESSVNHHVLSSLSPWAVLAARILQLTLSLNLLCTLNLPNTTNKGTTHKKMNEITAEGRGGQTVISPERHFSESMVVLGGFTWYHKSSPLNGLKIENTIHRETLIDSNRVYTHLSNKLWFASVGDVILTYVTVEPIADVKESVVQWYQNVRDQCYKEMVRFVIECYSIP